MEFQLLAMNDSVGLLILVVGMAVAVALIALLESKMNAPQPAASVPEERHAPAAAAKAAPAPAPRAPVVETGVPAEVFDGPLPSPYMLFVHDVAPHWQDRVPAVVHVDGTARIQSVDERDNPLLARMLRAFERRTGLPVVVNTSLNTAGRPMVDHPREALEVFGSAPVDLLAMGPFAIRRNARGGVGGDGGDDGDAEGLFA